MSFHVIEKARITTGKMRSDYTDGNNGCFDVDSCQHGWRLALLASDGDGWEHVSVHVYRGAGRMRTQLRTPAWTEMAQVKALFWDDEDVVMQLHPKRSEYVNNHPHVLHLWRPLTAQIPTPPPALVGVLQADVKAG